MIDRHFVALFVVVTGVLAAAVYSSNQAVMHGGTVLTLLAVASAVVGIIGLVVLARIVVLAERERERR